MKKGQSALEYLFSYGWVILILFIIAAVLYFSGVFNPDQNTATIVKGLSYFHFDDALINTDGGFFIELGNRRGEKLTVTNIDYQINYFSDCNNNDDETDILVYPDDTTSIILFPDNQCSLEGGEIINMNVTIDYLAKSGLEHSDKGTIRILVQEQEPLVSMNFEKTAPLTHNTSYQLPYRINYQVLGGGPEGSPEWQPFKYISNSTLDETSPQLVSGPNNNIFAVYQKWVNETIPPTSVYNGDYWDIYIKHSEDNTNSWSDEIRITDNLVADVQPNIIKTINNELILLFQEHDGSDYELFISNSSNGVNWSTPVQITNNSILEGDATIEQDSTGTLYIVYETVIPGDSDAEIYIINSTDKFTWSTPYPITNNSINDYDPDILIHDNIFYLAWSPRINAKNMTQEIYYSKTENPYDLNKWESNTVILTNNYFHDFEPSIFIDEYEQLFIAYIYWFEKASLDPNREKTDIVILDSTISTDSVWTKTRLTQNLVRDTYPGIIQDVEGFFHIIYSHSDGNNLRLVIQDMELNPYDALKLIINDPLPDNTTLVPGTISNTGTFDGSSINWELTNLYAGNTGYVSFNVSIDPAVTNGTIITNTAQLTYYNWENKIASQEEQTVNTICIE